MSDISPADDFQATVSKCFSKGVTFESGCPGPKVDWVPHKK